MEHGRSKVGPVPKDPRKDKYRKQTQRVIGTIIKILLAMWSITKWCKHITIRTEICDKEAKAGELVSTLQTSNNELS
eukprot:19595-Ditylum_brightwellii.AAC.1